MPALKYFLDTHILIWWLEDKDRLTDGQRAILADYEANKPFGVSDITLVEIGCLVQLGRVKLSKGVEDWLARATAEPLVRLCRITPAVVAEIARLPDALPKDTADRIIVATTRLQHATLLTCDQRIIDAKAVPTLGATSGT
jgi:PIN domain nuclease of toxin-antitoxin system